MWPVELIMWGPLPSFHLPQDWPHSYHIHVCESNGFEEKWNLAFRDFLRDHADQARQYENLKRKLASRYSAETFESRNAYSDAKSRFIEKIIEMAFAQGYP